MNSLSRCPSHLLSTSTLVLFLVLVSCAAPAHHPRKVRKSSPASSPITDIPVVTQESLDNTYDEVLRALSPIAKPEDFESTRSSSFLELRNSKRRDRIDVIEYSLRLLRDSLNSSNTARRETRRIIEDLQEELNMLQGDEALWHNKGKIIRDEGGNVKEGQFDPGF